MTDDPLDAMKARWNHIQGYLFPWLREEVDPMTEALGRLVTTLDVIGLGQSAGRYNPTITAQCQMRHRPELGCPGAGFSAMRPSPLGAAIVRRAAGAWGGSGTKATQRLVDIEALDQSGGGRNAQHRLGDESPGDGSSLVSVLDFRIVLQIKGDGGDSETRRDSRASVGFSRLAAPDEDRSLSAPPGAAQRRHRSGHRRP